MLERFTMRLFGCCLRPGRKSRTPYTMPQKLMPISHSMSALESSSNVPCMATPALLISRVIRWCWARTSAAKCSTCLESATFRRGEETGAAGVPIWFSVSFSVASFISAMASAIFSRASCLASSRPMPEPAPVMTETPLAKYPMNRPPPSRPKRGRMIVQVLDQVLDFRQCLIEVGDEIFDVFNADGQAHQARCDANALANLCRYGGVSHRGRMRDQSFHAAEAFGQRAKLHVIQKSRGRRLRAQVEGNHAAEAALLTLGQFVLGMGCQPRVYGALHFLVAFQKFGDGHAVGVVAVHAHGQGLDPAGDEKAVHGRKARADRSLQEVNRVRVRLGLDDHRATGAIAVAVQIFGHGMHHDAGA